MSVLTNAAKQRPQYMSRVIQAFEALHGRLTLLVFETLFSPVIISTLNMYYSNLF